MESPIVPIRLSKEQRAKVQEMAAAEGVTVSEWIRRLVAKATGIEAELKEGGLANMSKRRRKEVQRAGGLAKAEAEKKE